MYVAEDESELELTCTTTGFPVPSVHWIKDGVSLDENLYDTETGVLIATPTNVTNGRLHGVYQCFAGNSAGVGVAMSRVLIEGEFLKKRSHR